MAKPSSIVRFPRREPVLPRFNPQAEVPPSLQLMIRNREQHRQARARRIRNQRIGDFALGALFVLVGYVIALLVGRIL